MGAPMQMMSHQEMRADAVVVRFEGEVDLAVADAFRSHLSAAMVDAVSAKPVRPLIIDLQAVAFFGSSALNDVVRCHDEAASNGVAVGLVSANPIVGRVIHATALVEILALYQTVDDELRSLVRIKPN